MNNDYVKFQMLEKELIVYYNEKYSNIDDMKLSEKIEDIKFLCNTFCKRIEKSNYKKEILEWFDNEYLHVLSFKDLILSAQHALNLDSLQIYYKFLNNEPIEIDSESDLEFYKYLETQYDAIMF